MQIPLETLEKEGFWCGNSLCWLIGLWLPQVYIKYDAEMQKSLGFCPQSQLTLTKIKRQLYYSDFTEAKLSFLFMH